MNFRAVHPWLRPALVAAALAACAPAAGAEPELHGTQFEAAAPEEFALHSAAGPVRLSDFRGQPVVLFFGFTSCPDVCPTTLARLGQAMLLLGPQAERVQVMMVTVDPERDTPAKLAEYTAAFDPRFVGLGGTPAELEAVTTRFGIYHAGSAGHGGMSHTPNPLLLGPEGSLRAIWPPDLAPEDMAADLRALIPG